MNLNNFTIYTPDVSTTKWLSIRPFTCYFAKYELPNFINQFCRGGYEELGKFVSLLRSGEYIPKENYSAIETKYIYLQVGNFSACELDLTENVFLDEEIGSQYEEINIEANDLVITRSGTVGKVSIFQIPPNFKDNVFIPSHHLAVIKTYNKDDLLFLKYYLNYSFCQDFFNAFSTGKVQKEITNWSVQKIPIPILLDKSTLTNKFAAIDAKIAKYEIDNIPLQKLIGNILIKYGIKSSSSLNDKKGVFTSSLCNISKNKDLRIGAKYNDFWLNHNGNLFEGTNEEYDVQPLKRYIKISSTSQLQKGLLEEERLLVDFDQVHAYYGEFETNNVVIEIGSSKIEFGNCDFLTNKLRPYLGYTILNEKESKLIGTTEFIPFDIIDESKVSVKYIRYLLLSDEYLEKSKYLMSGKEHPRINPLDILNIQVPIPPLKVQQDIVNEISVLEAKAKHVRKEISILKESINNIISTELDKLIE